MAEDEPQIVELLEQKVNCINTIDDKWISEWAHLIEKYFKHETRNHIRLKAIAMLSQIFSKYHVICGEDLMNKIILPNFNEADQETDSVVRKPIVHLLFDVASVCLSYKHCNAILAIVRKILNKPFKQKCEEQNALVYIIGNIDVIDSRLIISNLTKLFMVKFWRLPIDPAVNMLDIAVSYLNLTYKCPLQDPSPAEIPMIRRELFSFFLNIRCNKHGHLGVLAHNQNLNELTYSPFIICVKRPRAMEQCPSSPKPDSPTQMSFPAGHQAGLHYQQQHRQPNQNPDHHHPYAQQQHLHPQQQQQQQPQPLQSPPTPHNIFIPNAYYPKCPIESRCVNLDAMFVGIIECVQQESDLDVLKLVLDGLPGLLANKPLVSTLPDERINQLCLALSGKVTNRSKFDIVKCSLNCLTSLLIYKRSLDHRSVKTMLSAFEDSLKVSRHPIVPLFTTCLIELRDSSEMARFVPVVLNRLRKFSPTINLGISMLEFLSYLILFPKLYENFSEDEYTFIFAIALPYTNPFRFSDYITCLAFRVIAMWYLNCRPSLRCAFVSLVKKSLHSNVIQPLKENSMPMMNQPTPVGSITSTPPITYSLPANMSPMDQRKRSSSLNTENNFRKHQQLQQQQQHHASIGFISPQLCLQVNEELIETFADLLSRYTHGQYLAIAPKNRCTERLVDRATSQTWLHGNSLVTITAGRSNNGWAEIMVRRPTGNTSWIGRLQNTVGALPMFNQQVYTNSLNFGNDIISLFSTMSLTSDDGSENIDPSLCIASAISAAPSPPVLTGASAGPSSALSSPHYGLQQANMGAANQSAGAPMTPGGASTHSTQNISPPSHHLHHLHHHHLHHHHLHHHHHNNNNNNNGTGNNNNQALINGSQGMAVNQQQLHQTNSCSRLLEQPILLPKDKKSDIALSNFDHITPYETHKVGVIYVNKNQVDNRAAILSNQCGSPRYYEFLSHIGTCIILNDIDPEIYFIGGLDVKGNDGKYAYFWKDNVTQVIFHVATFMLARENDPQCNNKNRHIGNDHVCIVYNDSGAQFRLSTIKGTGQFIMACIVISPLDEDTNLVEVEVLPDLRQILGDIEPKVLSNLGASLFARQLAIHLNLASKIHERRHCEGFLGKEPYVSNWVERLRCIKRIRARLDENRKAANSNSISSRGSNTLK